MRVRVCSVVAPRRVCGIICGVAGEQRLYIMVKKAGENRVLHIASIKEIC